MTTPAQRLASQQNGRRSLGPVTPAGRLAFTGHVGGILAFQGELA